MFHAVQGLAVQQGSPEWLRARRQGIGGSDAAAACGLDEFTTPIMLYEEKRGMMPFDPGNWYTARGKALEPVLRQHYQMVTGRPVMQPARMLHHPRHRFMFVSLDGFTTIDGPRIWEGKSATSAQGWGEQYTDEIPLKYLIQCHHALMVTGADACDVSVTIGGAEPRQYVVEPNKELHEMIEEREVRFWECVRAQREPEPANLDEISARVKLRKGTALVANARQMALFEEYVSLRASLSDLDGKKEEIKELLQADLLAADAQTLTDAAGTALLTLRQPRGREQTDTKELKRAYPAIYNQLTRQMPPTRALVVNE